MKTTENTLAVQKISGISILAPIGLSASNTPFPLKLKSCWNPDSVIIYNRLAKMRISILNRIYSPSQPE